MAMDSRNLADALRRVAAATASASDELCAADGAMGDGDLGITVADGFREAAVSPLPDDFGMALLEVAKAFQRVSSSSYGTLTATGFMAAAKLTRGRTSVDAGDLPTLVAAARDAMAARGKGALGDKTVLDSLDAIATALDGAEPSEMRNLAVAAARDTVETFTAKPNRLGRARMFGEKSIGLPDPGQLALLRIVEAL
jgi:dihydroxyacetone kinase-like protein